MQETKPKTFYICNEPFNGSILNTMHNGIVDYTGEQVENKYISEDGAEVTEISFVNGLTFEQYKEKKGGNLKVVDGVELDALLKEYHENLKEDFTEVTEERFFDALECLPPKRWHTHRGIELFFMCEAYTGTLYTCYARVNKSHYKALRCITESSEELTKRVIKAHEKTQK